MLHRMDRLLDFEINASDGEVGRVRDLHVDDRRWAVRYLVVETGSWLEARRVLISPLAIDSIDWVAGTISLRLTRQQVRGSPAVDSPRPLSRQHEISYFNYYGYPDYLSGPLLWGLTPYPVIPDDVGLPLTTDAIADRADEAAAVREGDGGEHDGRHLRSAVEITGWPLQARDHPIGHLEDFIIDSGSWALHYLVVDTASWWLGRHVVVPVQWILRLDDAHAVIEVDVLREQIRAAPEYDPAIALSRDYEIQLFGHYQRPGYWF